MNNSFYSMEELKNMGFRELGTKNVLISKKASFYGVENISIGNDVRIDDFCVVSGKITIHNHVHLAVFCALFGGSQGIELNDYSGLASRVVIYAESDDYTGNALTCPTVPNKYRHVIGGPVCLNKYVVVGSGSTILPGVTIGEGSSVGSMSLVAKSLEEWGVYVGIPCKKLKDRKKDLLALAERLEKEEQNQ